MHIDGLHFIAPHITGQEVNEAEILGSATWLWMHSESHRDAPLRLLSTLLLPAIKNRQFILASEAGKPVFYMAWAYLSDEAERRYLKNPPQSMPEEDWASGNRTWILDWVAPFGHSRQISRLLKQRLLPSWYAHALYHRGNEKGLRIMTFHGVAVTAEEVRFLSEKTAPAIP